MAAKDAVNRADMVVATWFYDACTPFNVTFSPYYKSALNVIAKIGGGYKGSSDHDLRVNILGDCKKEFGLLRDSYRRKWASSGCTVMVDGWTDQRQRTLIDFLIYSPTCMSFVKSIDASNMVKDASTLRNLLFDVAEWVGPANVMHVVTDKATNYAAAGKKLQEKFDIYWSPCAAHCINLIKKDICSMPHFVQLASCSSTITVFVNNHCALLSWFRKRPCWKDIIRPAATRFATILEDIRIVMRDYLVAPKVDLHHL